MLLSLLRMYSFFWVSGNSDSPRISNLLKTRVMCVYIVRLCMFYYVYGSFISFHVFFSFYVTGYSTCSVLLSSNNNSMNSSSRAQKLYWKVYIKCTNKKERGLLSCKAYLVIHICNVCLSFLLQFYMYTYLVHWI